MGSRILRICALSGLAVAAGLIGRAPARAAQPAKPITATSAASARPRLADLLAYADAFPEASMRPELRAAAEFDDSFGPGSAASVSDGASKVVATVATARGMTLLVDQATEKPEADAQYVSAARKLLEGAGAAGTDVRVVSSGPLESTAGIYGGDPIVNVGPSVSELCSAAFTAKLTYLGVTAYWKATAGHCKNDAVGNGNGLYRHGSPVTNFPAPHTPDFAWSGANMYDLNPTTADAALMLLGTQAPGDPVPTAAYPKVRGGTGGTTAKTITTVEDFGTFPVGGTLCEFAQSVEFSPYNEFNCTFLVGLVPTITLPNGNTGEWFLQIDGGYSGNGQFTPICERGDSGTLWYGAYSGTTNISAFGVQSSRSKYTTPEHQSGYYCYAGQANAIINYYGFSV